MASKTKSDVANEVLDNLTKCLNFIDLDNKDKVLHLIEYVRAEYNKGSRKGNGTSTSKKVYGTYENVLLTDEEYAKLCEMPNGNEAIEFLSEYREYKGYKAKSDYLAIRKWVFDALKEQKQKRAKVDGTKRADYIEREYTPAEVQEIFKDIDRFDDVEI